MITLTADRSAFATARKGRLLSADEELEPAVKAAIAAYNKGEADWYDSLLAKALQVYLDVYHEEGGSGGPTTHLQDDYKSRVLRALQKTENPDSATEGKILRWLSTITINAATEAAAGEDDRALLLEWVSMHDGKVRQTHAAADGQQRPDGEQFLVGGSKMRYPGDTTAPIDEWIECRCVVRPTLEDEALVAAVDTPPSAVVVALPKADDPVHGIGDEQKHVTLAFLGDNPGDMSAVHEHVAAVAAGMKPFDADVSGGGTLGPNHAQVMFTESPEIQNAHDQLMDPNTPTGTEASKVEQHPHFVPHVTTHYGEGGAHPEAANVGSIGFDRLALWHGEDQTEYPLGDPMTESAPETEPTDAEAPAGLIPWHGVLAPEGVFSGDKRQFLPDSLSHRDLPLPLTWQKSSAPGHDGSVTIASIDQIKMIDGMMHGAGLMLDTSESDELMGLMAHFGKYGVSVDADNGEMEYNEDTGELTFSSARVCSASAVSIPAFAEAYIALGPWPDDHPFHAAEGMGVPPQESLAASGAKFGRGPGWVTNPEDTKRLHDYWTRKGEEGYAKINWGVPGDFNRCRILVGEEIAENSPESTVFLNQICAQWHHDALGIWPGQELAAGNLPEEQLEVEGEMAPAVSLVASSSAIKAPKAWFQNPNLTQASHLTVTEEGRVFGHIAEWTSCHLSYAGTCVAPPHSPSNYAYYATGRVLLEDGSMQATGILTTGGGHAGKRLTAAAALAHYDSTSTAVADVAVGEDEFGIWCAGWVRPGTTPEQVVSLRASDVSGDWREINGELEMIAALGVNTQGFAVKIAAGIENGRQLSLVAAGMVQASDNPVLDLASAVADELEARAARRETVAALVEKFKEN